MDLHWLRVIITEMTDRGPKNQAGSDQQRTVLSTTSVASSETRDYPHQRQYNFAEIICSVYEGGPRAMMIDN